MEEFMRWIKDKINPMRTRNGVSPLSIIEQVMCYEVLEAYLIKMGIDNLFGKEDYLTLTESEEP